MTRTIRLALSSLALALAVALPAAAQDPTPEQQARIDAARARVAQAHRQLAAVGEAVRRALADIPTKIRDAEKRVRINAGPLSGTYHDPKNNWAAAKADAERAKELPEAEEELRFLRSGEYEKHHTASLAQPRADLAAAERDLAAVYAEVSAETY